MSDQFQVKYQGKQLETVSWAELYQQACRGQLTPLHKISPDGVAWYYASEFPELFGRQPAPTPQVETTQQPTAAPTVSRTSVAWFLAVGEEKQGPLSHQAILDKLQARQITLDDLVWRDGFSEWRTVRSAFPYAAKDEQRALRVVEARRKKEEARKRRAMIPPEQQSTSHLAMASVFVPLFWSCVALLLFAVVPGIGLLLGAIASALACILSLAGLYHIGVSDGYRKGIGFSIVGFLIGILLAIVITLKVFLK